MGLNSNGLRASYGRDRAVRGRMQRHYRVRTGTVRGQRAEPFHVTAELSFRWDAAKSARSGTTEEDVLTNLLGAFQRPAEHHAAVATARRVPGRYVAS